jgi:hypothetical protein
MQTIVIPNVKPDRLAYYLEMAKTLGGTVVSVAHEPDNEFTVVIRVPA